MGRVSVARVLKPVQDAHILSGNIDMVAESVQKANGSNAMVPQDVLATTSRRQNLDFIRGMMVLWVVISHIALNVGIRTFGTSYSASSIWAWMSFYMSTFFFFSGYLHNRQRSPDQIVRRGTRALLVPYLLFSAFGFLLYEVSCLLTSGKGLDWGIFKGFVSTLCLRSNTPLWFLISLFSVKVLYSFFEKYLGERTYYLTIIVAIVAILTCNKPQILGYGNIMLGFLFYGAGVFLQINESAMKRTWIVLLALSTYCIIPFICPLGLVVVTNFKPSGKPLFDIIFSLSACNLLWFVSRKITFTTCLSRYLIFIGANSLILFAYHRPVLNYVIDPICHYFHMRIYFRFLFSFMVLLVGFHTLLILKTRILTFSCNKGE